MIRLQRVGRKHEPVFRLVLTDSKNGPKSGKFLEVLGNYDSRRSEKAEFKVERVKHWMASGAQLSGTVHNILVERKVIDGKKINVLPKKSPVVSEEAKAALAEASKPKAAVVEEKVAEKETETITEEAPAPTNPIVGEPTENVGSEVVAE